jgi:arylsulfatase A-like enzyme
MRRRHSYGATDNIILDYRLQSGGREYIQGDIAKENGSFRLYIKVIGTAAIRQVDIIRSNTYLHNRQNLGTETAFTFVDNNPLPGESYYYVRVCRPTSRWRGQARFGCSGDRNEPPMLINRRTLLAGAATAATAQTDRPSRRPNVLLIMTDDQGYGDNAVSGNTIVRTPALAKLAAESARIDRFYVSPVCAPTRSSLLTGRYDLRCGVWGVTGGRETVRTSEVTLAEALKPAGYRTGLIGKWHLGEHYPYVPHNQGFDEFTGFRLGHWNRYQGPPLEHNGKPVRTKGYIADVFTDEAIRFIDQSGSEPFFLYLAYNTPHSPFIVPDRYYDRFEASGLSVPVASIYAMVENLDANVGRLMTHLDRSGLTRGTIVLFLCDNGPTAGARFNAGLRGMKAGVYEGGVRSPLWIRYPGRIAAKDVTGPAAHIDVYPTLLDLCNVRQPAGPPIDGISLLPAITKGTALPDRFLFTHQAGNRVRAPFPGAVRDRRWSLVNGKELYDLQADPGEQADVAAAHPQIAARMAAAYEKWFSQMADECRFEQPAIHVGYDEENPVVLQATRAKLSGGLKFFVGNGYAHDWATAWSESGIAEWKVDVVRDGVYEARVLYLSEPYGVGAKLSLTQAAVAKIEQATSNNPLPTGLRQISPHYQEFSWQTLRLGKLELKKGLQSLALRITGEQASGVRGVKSVLLRRM